LQRGRSSRAVNACDTCGAVDGDGHGGSP
jgi:hypothetical protein